MTQLRQFKEAMGDAGIHTDAEIIADGKLRRIHVEGDSPGTLNGWYVLFDDDILAGTFGCWKRGISQNWCSKSENALTPEERDAWKRRMAEAKQKRLEELHRLQAECRLKAEKIWNRAKQASDENPYLKLKGVHAYGVRSLGNTLVIPVRDTQKVLHGVQFVPPDGQGKKFLLHTAKSGHYHGFGKVKDNIILVCEGYATGASLHEATGHAVAVAFDAGNLKPVALELRKKYPNYRLVICADNDADKPDNPGVTKAIEAAKAVNGYVTIPEFVFTVEPVSSVLSVRNPEDSNNENCLETEIFPNELGGENE